MKINRIKKDKDFVVMHTHALRNKDLSLAAKGLHALIMQLPEDWELNVEGLVSLSKNGRDANASALKELELAGYVVKFKKREKGRFVGYEYNIYEVPQHSTNNGSTVNGKTVNGSTVNGSTVNGKTATIKYEDINSSKEDIKELNAEFENSTTPSDLEAEKVEPKNQPKQEKEKSAAKKEIPHIVEFEEAIAMLNEKSGRSFVVTNLDRKGKTDKYKKFAGLMGKGYSLEDVALVISDKCNEWRNDSKMAKYLQPATLFGSVKFEQYLEAIKAGLPTNEQTNNKQEPPFTDPQKEERYQSTIAWIVKRFEYIGESKVRQLNREEFEDIFCEEGHTYNQLKNYLSIKNIFSIFEQLLQRLATDNYLKKSTLYTHLLKSLKEEKALKLKQRS